MTPDQIESAAALSVALVRARVAFGEHEDIIRACADLELALRSAVAVPDGHVPSRSIMLEEAVSILVADLKQMLPDIVIKPDMRQHVTTLRLYNARGHFASVRLSKVCLSALDPCASPTKASVRLQSWHEYNGAMQPLYEDMVPLEYVSFNEVLATFFEKLHAGLPKPTRLVVREPDPDRLLHETVEDAVHAT